MKARAIIEIVRDEDGDIYDLNPVNPEMHLTFRRLLNGPYAYEQVITEGMGAHWDLNTEAPDAETLDSTAASPGVDFRPLSIFIRPAKSTSTCP